jgi:hypothetical protein
MSKKLPKIDLPLFELELPSTGKKIKYRPFSVKEEKILLVAQESDDPEQTVLSVKQIVNNCLVDTDIEKLAMFDLEYVLLMLRSKSVDNNIRFGITDPDTNESIELEIDLNEVKVTREEEHTNKVKINDDYSLFLRYPTIEEFIKIAGADPKDPLTSYFIMISCLDQIASESEVYKFSDYTDEEIDDFMENLQGDVVKKIQKFFETMPRLRHEMKYTNSEGKEQTFVIEGMRSFFI